VIYKKDFQVLLQCKNIFICRLFKLLFYIRYILFYWSTVMWPRTFISCYLRNIIVYENLFFLFVTACWSWECLSITNVFAVLWGSRGLTSSYIKALTFGLCRTTESVRESCWYVTRDRPYCRALRSPRQMRPNVYLAILNPACVFTIQYSYEFIRMSTGFHPFMSVVDRTQDFLR